MAEKTYHLTTAQIQQIVNYLVEKPYKETVMLLGMLQNEINKQNQEQLQPATPEDAPPQ